jgi:enterochelin esterase-like enzyme
MRQSQLTLATILLPLALLAACAPAISAPTPLPACGEDGRTLAEEIESPSLGWKMKYQYYLPPCYDQHPEATYPVVYLIPGKGGCASSWDPGQLADTADGLIRRGEAPPFILIMPNGYNSDSHGEALLSDLLPHVEEQLRIRDDRRYRGVGGVSFGGMVSYRLAFQHPDLFGSLGIFSSGVVGGDEGNMDDWIAATPSDQYPRVLIDHGDEDVLMATNAQRTVEVLEKWSIPYTLTIGEGGHNHVYWSSRFESYLSWFAEGWQ